MPTPTPAPPLPGRRAGRARRPARPPRRPTRPGGPAHPPPRPRPRSTGGAARAGGAAAPTVALLAWGDVWEDFLDTIGVSLDEFLTAMSGGGALGFGGGLLRG